jgi:hypothetical protein
MKYDIVDIVDSICLSHFAPDLLVNGTGQRIGLAAPPSLPIKQVDPSHCNCLAVGFSPLAPFLCFFKDWSGRRAPGRSSVQPHN